MCARAEGLCSPCARSRHARGQIRDAVARFSTGPLPAPLVWQMRRKGRAFSLSIIAVALLLLGFCCSTEGSGEFTEHVIGQSNPLAAGKNTITVMIKTNTTLESQGEKKSTLTISGLTGAPDIAKLEVGIIGLTRNNGQTSPELLVSQGELMLGTLKLTINQGYMLAEGVVCVISFEITNPSAAQEAAAVTIAASSGTGSENYPSAELTTDPSSADRYGVTDGGKPMKVVVPSFIAKSIGQSNPVASGLNNITVTIQTNINLNHSSSLTVSGLNGAPDNPSLALNSVAHSAADLFGGGMTQGTGTMKEGTLTLMVFTCQTVAAGTQYIFSFAITNPSAAQEAAAVSIASTIKDGNRTLGSYLQVAMDLPNAMLLGVTNGANPIRVVVPAFLTRKVGQSYPWPGGKNKVTITLRSNVDLVASDNATVTISGFSNAVASTLINLTGTEGHFLFSDGVTPATGSWNFRALSLKIDTNKVIRAGKTYVFGFEILTSATQAAASRVLIAAASGTTFTIPWSVMTAAMTAMDCPPHSTSSSARSSRNFTAEGCTFYRLEREVGCTQPSLQWFLVGTEDSPAACMHRVMTNMTGGCKRQDFFLWQNLSNGNGSCYCPGGSAEAIDQCSYNNTLPNLPMGASTYTIHTGSRGFRFSVFPLRGSGQSAVRVALHANSLVGISHGQRISSWGKFSQFHVSSQPTLVSSGGQQAVSFHSNTSTEGRSLEYLDGGSIKLVFSSGLTIIARLKMTGSSAIKWEKIFDFGKGEFNDNVLLTRLDETSNIGFEVANANQWACQFVANNVLVQQEWMTIAVRYNAGTVNMLKNGEALALAGKCTSTPADRNVSKSYLAKSNWVADATTAMELAGLLIIEDYLDDDEVKAAGKQLEEGAVGSSCFLNTDSICLCNAVSAAGEREREGGRERERERECTGERKRYNGGKERTLSFALKRQSLRRQRTAELLAAAISRNKRSRHLMHTLALSLEVGSR
jgi:hypothetical protein